MRQDHVECGDLAGNGADSIGDEALVSANIGGRDIRDGGSIGADARDGATVDQGHTVGAPAVNRRGADRADVERRGATGVNRFGGRLLRYLRWQIAARERGAEKAGEFGRGET